MREIRIIPGCSKRLSKKEVIEHRKKPLSDRVVLAISAVHTLMPSATNWLEVKKQLLLELPVHERQLFSTREQKTKCHHPFNEFEQRVRSEWLRLTGNTLSMPENKMLPDVDPEAYR